MSGTRLTFIGGGNMAASLVGGLIADGWKPANICVADTDNGRLQRLAERFGIFAGKRADRMVDVAAISKGKGSALSRWMVKRYRIVVEGNILRQMKLLSAHAKMSSFGHRFFQLDCGRNRHGR